MLALGSPGLYFVDHIHFQYNGLLLGILLISIAFIRKVSVAPNHHHTLLLAVLLTYLHCFALTAVLRSKTWRRVPPLPC